MRSRLILSTALLVLAIATAASAATFVRTDPGGALLPAGSTISGTGEGPAIFHLTGVGTASCANAAFDATVGAGGGAAVDGTLTGLTLTSCVDTIPVVNFLSCHLTSPSPTATLAAVAGGATVTITNGFMRCTVQASPKACYVKYASAAGAFTNATSTLGFTDMVGTHSVPPGATDDLGAVCGTGATVTRLAFADVRSAGGTTATVTTS